MQVWISLKFCNKNFVKRDIGYKREQPLLNFSSFAYGIQASSAYFLQWLFSSSYKSYTQRWSFKTIWKQIVARTDLLISQSLRVKTTPRFLAVMRHQLTQASLRVTYSKNTILGRK